MTQTVPDISPLMPMHQDPLLVVDFGAWMINCISHKRIHSISCPCANLSEAVLHYSDVISGRDGVSNHQPHHCLLNRLFGRRSKKTSKLRVTGLLEGNSPVIREFPSQMASHVENASIWLRHHEEKRSPKTKLVIPLYWPKHLAGSVPFRPSTGPLYWTRDL